MPYRFLEAECLEESLRRIALEQDEYSSQRWETIKKRISAW